MPVRMWGTKKYINTTDLFIPQPGAVAALKDGGFVVGWENIPAGGNAEIRLQVFDADGQPRGEEILVSTPSAPSQRFTISSLADGGFLVGYSEGLEGQRDIKVKAYDAEGNFVADRAPSVTVNDEADADIATGSVANSPFMVVWQDNASGNVVGTIRAANGVMLRGPFTVNADAANIQLQPSVAASDSGSTFVTVWKENGAGGDRIEFRISTAGGELGGDFSAAAPSLTSKNDPEVLFIDENKFVVAWMAGSEIKARVFDTAGNALSAELDVSPGAEPESWPSITRLQNGGGFAIAWSESGHVKLQVFSDSGSKVGGEIIVDIHNHSMSAGFPAIATLQDGRIAVSWEEDEQIALQIVDPRDGIVVGTTDSEALYGNATANDEIVALDGEDTLFGLGGADALYGGWHADQLYGGNGDDFLYGDISDEAYGDWPVQSRMGGSDILDGGVGVDHMEGGGGNDTFVYSSGYGTDTIADFLAGAASGDKIDIRGLTGGYTVGDVLGRATQAGGDTVINFGAGDTLTLKGVAKTSLNGDDFAGLRSTYADFSRDGTTDILWRHSDGTLVTWMPNGAGSFTSAVLTPPDTTGQLAEVGDFNGDGRSDILWRDADQTAVAWLSNGTGGFTPQVLGAPEAAWQVAEAADVNGDGHADVVWRNSGSGQVAVWLMDETGLRASQVLGAPETTWRIAGAGDFNTDGRSDILWRHADGTVVAWLLDGAGRLMTRTFGAADTAWQIEGTGDFNADNRDDILWRHTDGSVVAWLMDADYDFASRTYASPDHTWQIQDTGDFNRDGRDDILWRNLDGTVVPWLLTGGAGFSGSTLAGPEAAWQIVNDPTGLV